MLKTKTGGISIGFREVGSWKEDFDAVLKWGQSNGFSVIDVVGNGTAKREFLLKNGLRVGSADLPQRSAMITTDRARRKDAVAENTEFIHLCAGAGAKRPAARRTVSLRLLST